MGQTSGTASGAAGGGLTQTQQMGMQAGMGAINSGAQQEQLIGQLARMGPPPAMNTAGAPIAGQDIVGKYGANMRPPNVNYRSRQDNQMNPSIGQMLTGAA